MENFKTCENGNNTSRDNSAPKTFAVGYGKSLADQMTTGFGGSYGVGENQLQKMIDSAPFTSLQLLSDIAESQEKCTCRCHEEGVVMMHCFPCC